VELANPIRTGTHKRRGLFGEEQPGFRSVHRPTAHLLIRRAVISEQKELEALQLRASLTNAGDRDALLAHLDAIELPIDQIAAGAVFVSERNGVIVGFAALLRRPDGDVELDGSTALCVIGNPHALHFYSVCGFNVIGTIETRFGSGLLMRKMV
jgi:hypothetical protein